MRCRHWLPFAILALGGALPCLARATLIRIDFRFPYTGTDGVATVASGWFSFDDKILPPPLGSMRPGWDEWSMNLAFAGDTFASSNSTLYLNTNQEGKIGGWGLYGTGDPLTGAPSFGIDAFRYPGASGMEVGYWLVPGGPIYASMGYWISSVPEPTVVTLLGLGLVPLVMIRRRKRMQGSLHATSSAGERRSEHLLLDT